MIKRRNHWLGKRFTADSS